LLSASHAAHDGFCQENHHKIRTSTIDGDVWFYALDICEALDIKNPRDALVWQTIFCKTRGKIYNELDENKLK
jgi:prophage antirepressor-like protein